MVTQKSVCESLGPPSTVVSLHDVIYMSCAMDNLSREETREKKSWEAWSARSTTSTMCWKPKSSELPVSRIVLFACPLDIVLSLLYHTIVCSIHAYIYLMYYLPGGDGSCPPEHAGAAGIPTVLVPATAKGKIRTEAQSESMAGNDVKEDTPQDGGTLFHA